MSNALSAPVHSPLSRQPDEVAYSPVMYDAKAALAHMIAHQRSMAQIIKDAMVDGHDYGVVPGTRKPSLYQPGADKLVVGFRLHAVPKLMASTMTPEFASKTYTVTIYDTATGAALAACSGSCNSAEDRFFRKSNGSRSPMYNDARECENTMDKMAQKRAKVGAVIMALAIADIFTQDVEDMPREHLGLGNDTSTPADHSRTLVADKPDGDKKVPFGKSKGIMFKDMPVEELVNMRDWAADKDAAKFKDLIEAVDRHVATRIGKEESQSTTTASAPSAPKGPETASATGTTTTADEAWSAAKVAAEALGDDLPF